eukprot:GDKH01025525.1.p4 GENE.GDKH01025525.1~~GDKH01025525.1.p4  ORF type:complete len:51 (+),score=13.44 GDKH01025525.1:90-242(+)
MAGGIGSGRHEHGDSAVDVGLGTGLFAVLETGGASQVVEPWVIDVRKSPP